jgi:hypothetical protein
MDTTHTRLVTFGAALLLLTPAAPGAQPAGNAEGIVVIDFANGNTGRSSSLASTPALRTGTPSTIRIIKHGIDLVPDALISFDGATINGSITHGRTTGNIGFIQMNATMDGLPPLSATLNVGASDHFSFRSVNKGLISSVGFTPNPTAIKGGTSFAVNVQGQGLGHPVLSQISCHSLTGVNSSNTALTATVTRAANCGSTLGPFSFTISGSSTEDPPSYATSSGTRSFSFGPYEPPPPCPAPSIGAPVITAPLDNQVLASPVIESTRSVTVRWNGRTDNGVSAPNNEWVVTTIQHQPKGSVAPDPSTSKTVTGTQTSTSLGVPGSYTVKVRAKNCGGPAPDGSVSFRLQ